MHGADDDIAYPSGSEEMKSLLASSSVVELQVRFTQHVESARKHRFVSVALKIAWHAYLDCQDGFVSFRSAHSVLFFGSRPGRANPHQHIRVIERKLRNNIPDKKGLCTMHKRHAERTASKVCATGHHEMAVSIFSAKSLLVRTLRPLLVLWQHML